MRRRNLFTGFTIIELLIVIAVIGILVTLTLVGFNGVQQSVRDKALISDAEAVTTLVTRYSLQHGGAYGGAVKWYSAGAANPNYSFTPSTGNIVDVVANSTDYCIRVYNQNSNKRTVTTAQTKESSVGACTTLTPSVAAGGTLTCPTGFIVVPGDAYFSQNDFCVMKYEAKNVSGVATSQATGTAWGSISQTTAATTATAACTGCHLVTESEWLTIAHNALNVASNWSGGVVGTGFVYRGHSDNVPASLLAASSDDNDGYNGTGQSAGSTERRTLTLSNGQVIWDLAGNASEWTQSAITTGQPGSASWAWRDWNSLVTAGSFSATANPVPSYATPAASSWTSTQSIGQIYSNTANTTSKGFIRGGDYGGSTSTGIFTLGLGNPPSDTYPYLSFRVAK